MKSSQIHFSTYSFLAAFIIGVILFTIFWKSWFGSASGGVVLAGMAGVAVVVSSFWIRNELKHRNKDK